MDTTTIIVLSIISALILVLIILKIVSMMKGKIEISLNNFNFSPGDSINGKIILNLKKPIQAKSLNVRLVAESSSNKRTTLGNSKHTHSQKHILFDFIQPIDGEKTYSAGQTEYDFSIKVPENAVTNSTGNAIADNLIKSAGQVFFDNLSFIKWYVTTELDIAGWNLSNKVQINIS